jgi:hypothetical protein
MAAAASVVLRRARVGSRKQKQENELYPSTIPDESEWIATHDIEMLMLDGYGRFSMFFLLLSWW